MLTSTTEKHPPHNLHPRIRQNEKRNRHRQHRPRRRHGRSRPRESSRIRPSPLLRPRRLRRRTQNPPRSRLESARHVAAAHGDVDGRDADGDGGVVYFERVEGGDGGGFEESGAGAGGVGGIDV